LGYIIILLFLFGCSNPIKSDIEKPIFINYDMRLPIDENGNYHLELNREKWQTTHRVDGYIYGSENISAKRIEWDSNLYWIVGDTLGYIYKRGLTDEFVYVNYDTLYLTWFSGQEVPTTNFQSYTHHDGTFSNMIAPTKSMIGDTLRLVSEFQDKKKTFNIVLE